MDGSEKRSSAPSSGRCSSLQRNDAWSFRHLSLVYTSSLQGGEYGTDEEEDEDEEVSPSYPSAIEVFDLAENEDLSPLETDPEKLAHKYKEVMKRALPWILSCLITEHPLRGTCIFKTVVFFCGKAPDQARCDPG